MTGKRPARFGVRPKTETMKLGTLFMERKEVSNENQEPAVHAGVSNRGGATNSRRRKRLGAEPGTGHQAQRVVPLAGRVSGKWRCRTEASDRAARRASRHAATRDGVGSSPAAHRGAGAQAGTQAGTA